MTEQFPDTETINAFNKSIADEFRANGGKVGWPIRRWRPVAAHHDWVAAASQGQGNHALTGVAGALSDSFPLLFLWAKWQRRCSVAARSRMEPVSASTWWRSSSPSQDVDDAGQRGDVAAHHPACAADCALRPAGTRSPEHSGRHRQGPAVRVPSPAVRLSFGLTGLRPPRSRAGGVFAAAGRTSSHSGRQRCQPRGRLGRVAEPGGGRRHTGGNDTEGEGSLSGAASPFPRRLRDRRASTCVTLSLGWRRCVARRGIFAGRVPDQRLGLSTHAQPDAHPD